MRTVIKVISFLLLIPWGYATWAMYKWDPVNNQTGEMYQCRWKTDEGIKTYDCLIKLSNGEIAGVSNFILDDESHKNITVKVEVNKLRKKLKRYTFISSS